MKDLNSFLSDPLNAQLIALLEAAPLEEEEKESWRDMLPLMTDDEKKRLIENFQEEIDDFEEQEEDIIDQLMNSGATLY